MAPKRKAADVEQRQPRGSSTHVSQIQFDGRPCELVVDIVAESDPDTSACVSKYVAEIRLDWKDGSEPAIIGMVVGKTVDKVFVFTTKRPRGQKPSPLWIKDLLTPPVGYMGNVHSHNATEDDDDMSDMQKVFQLLFTPTGKIRDQVAEFAPMLEAGSKIHYIHYYRLEKVFRGSKGFGQFAMWGYFEALKSVSNGFDFDGTVILPPAPLLDDWQSEVHLRQGQTRWREQKIKLNPSYKKTGFKEIYRGDDTHENAISVMGLSMSDLPAPPAADDPSYDGKTVAMRKLNSDDAEASSSASSPLFVPPSETRSNIALDPADDVSDSQRAAIIKRPAVINPPIAAKRPMLRLPTPENGWTSESRSGEVFRTIIVPPAVRGTVPSAEKNELKQAFINLDAAKLTEGEFYLYDGVRYLIDKNTKTEWLEKSRRDQETQNAQRKQNGSRSGKAYWSMTAAMEPPHPHGKVDGDLEHEIVEILDEAQDTYFVRWSGVDQFGEPWVDTWECQEKVSDELQEVWEQQKADEGESDYED